MKKFIFLVLFFIFVLACALIFSACGTGLNDQNNNNDNNPSSSAKELEYTLSNDGNYYIVSGQGDLSGDISIPDTYKSLPVTEIADGAFRSSDDITKVNIGKSVKSIGDGAFYECEELEYVIFSENSQLETIEENVFSYCRSLKSVTFPSTVTKIGNAAFQYDYALATVTFGENSCLQSIGSDAFADCLALKEIEIPDSVVSIDRGAFGDCISLEKVTFGENSQLESLGGTTGSSGSIFSGCSKLVEITLPENLKAIGYEAFWGCSSLVSITIPKNVTEIGTRAFEECVRLVEVYDLTDSLNISAGSEDNGYVGCYALQVFTDEKIPSGVSVIDDYIFYNYSLENVLLGYMGDEAEAVLPENNGNNYKIYNGAFMGCLQLRRVEIPDNVSYIGYKAFAGCSRIEEVSFGKSVTEIGENAFEKCYDLSVIRFTEDSCLETIGDNVFLKCNSLSDITIPNSVNSIGQDAFTSCPIKVATLPVYAVSFINKDKLTSLVITDGISIADNEFQDCKNLESVVLPDDLTEIGDQAFDNCIKLAEINIPDSVIAIGMKSFYNCYNLKNITFGSKVKTIGDYAFYGCSNITDIGKLQNIQSIGSCAFKQCSITSVYIPPSLSYIGTDAFFLTDIQDVYIDDLKAWCAISFGDFNANPLYDAQNFYVNNERVVDLIIPEGTTIIKDFAFCNNKNIDIKSINIPDSVETIGKYVFSGCNYVESIITPFVGADRNDETNAYVGYLFGEQEYQNNVKCSPVLNYVEITDSYKIGTSAFYGCDSLKSAVISEGVTEIGRYAFYECTNLSSITLPGSLKAIDEYAFYHCINLTSVTIPKQVTAIKGYAFFECFKLVEICNLSSVNISKKSTNNGFAGCYADTICYKTNDLKVQSDNEGFIFYETDSVCFLLGYVGNQEIITLPNISNGKEYKIYEYAFAYNQKITKIIISDTISEIGYKAFSNCAVLQEVAVGNGVKEIKKDLFYNSKNISRITLGDNVNSIDPEAFNGCSGLSYISVSENNSDFSSQDGIIYNKNKTQFIFVPKKIKGDIIIPDSVTSIDAGRFKNCSELTGVLLPDGLITIGATAFQNCKNLVSINIPADIVNIGDYAFSGCSKITVNENGISYVGNWAVSCDENLTEAVFKEGTIGILGSAFSDCVNLESISIPASVLYIKEYTFADCGNLVYLFVDSSNPKYYVSGDCLIDGTSKTLIRGCNSSIIPKDGSIENIGDSAFRGCSEFTEITIPRNVITIGDSAFADCGDFIVYYEGSISDWCNLVGHKNILRYCNELFINNLPLSGILEIPDNVTSIPEYAFYGCNKITGIKIPDSVTGIGDAAFYGCESLNNIVIPGSVKNIGYSCFENCTALNDITISDGVEKIGNSAFAGCISLTGIIIPDTVQYLGANAFVGCNKLRDLTIPFLEDSLGYLFEGGFSYAVPNSLQNVVVRSGAIEGGGFAECSNLRSVTLGEGVFSIGAGSFYRCFSLGSVYFEDPTGWKRYGLSGSWIEIPATDLSNDRKAAQLLVDTLCWYNWARL